MLRNIMKHHPEIGGNTLSFLTFFMTFWGLGPPRNLLAPSWKEVPHETAKPQITQSPWGSYFETCSCSFVPQFRCWFSVYFFGKYPARIRQDSGIILSSTWKDLDTYLVMLQQDERNACFLGVGRYVVYDRRICL